MAEYMTDEQYEATNLATRNIQVDDANTSFTYELLPIYFPMAIRRYSEPPNNNSIPTFDLDLHSFGRLNYGDAQHTAIMNHRGASAIALAQDLVLTTILAYRHWVARLSHVSSFQLLIYQYNGESEVELDIHRPEPTLSSNASQVPREATATLIRDDVTIAVAAVFQRVRNWSEHCCHHVRQVVEYSVVALHATRVLRVVMNIGGRSARNPHIQGPIYSMLAWLGKYLRNAPITIEVVVQIKVATAREAAVRSLLEPINIVAPTMIGGVMIYPRMQELINLWQFTPVDIRAYVANPASSHLWLQMIVG